MFFFIYARHVAYDAFSWQTNLPSSIDQWLNNTVHSTPTPPHFSPQKLRFSANATTHCAVTEVGWAWIQPTRGQWPRHWTVLCEFTMTTSNAYRSDSSRDYPNKRLLREQISRIKRLLMPRLVSVFRPIVRAGPAFSLYERSIINHVLLSSWIIAECFYTSKQTLCICLAYATEIGAKAYSNGRLL